MNFTKFAFCLILLALPPAAHAVELKISAQALEHTLKSQLFNTPDGRYYIKGNANSACHVYAESPKVSFSGDRIFVHVHTNAKLGTHLRGTCIGIGLSPDADVSLLPDAEGETIGFRDARIEHLSESGELNFVLMPFLSRKVPSSMTVNAATLLRQVLAQSRQSTGYDLKLDRLKIHSMQVEDNALVVDVDRDLSVN
ncbi:hypothetical protein [Alloacidobacterium sp.]|uniref:hypothetical protein n=1 Tax=Alloacidobacterium sp. TaxID=2951999 RepID=UPI002D4AE33B|nr:hypothetical protein [Alloacidobacterium sp.]HYK37338.1 hypothetical protein [Alloacidobacterium sp.]